MRAGINGRYPDAVVNCGSRIGGSVTASEPTAVFEVLSRRTAWLDQSLKLRDYDGVATIKAYVLIEQDGASGHLIDRVELLEGTRI